jgi:hypothetical protein
MLLQNGRLSGTRDLARVYGYKRIASKCTDGGTEVVVEKPSCCDSTAYSSRVVIRTVGWTIMKEEGVRFNTRLTYDE